MSQINKLKTDKLNQVVNCLINSFRNQMNYFEESYNTLFKFIETNDETTHNIQAFLNNFNSRQTIEKQIIDRKLKSLRSKPIYRTESSPFINLNNSFSNKSNKSFFNKNKTPQPVFGMTHPFSSNFQLFDNQNSNSDKNLSNVNAYKSGYLYKRAMHTRMGKNWLKRKCRCMNGIFYIYHNDVKTYI